MNLISSFIMTVDNSFASIAKDFSSEITNKLLPIFALFFSIYIIFKALKLMRGDSDYLVIDLLYLMLKMALILSLGLGVEGYVEYIIPIVRNFGNDLSTLTGYSWGGSRDIDELLNVYVKGASSSFTIINIVGSDTTPSNMFIWLTKMLLLLFGVLPLFSLITFFFVYQNIALNVLLYFGPLFIGLLLFESTRGYFDRWLSAIFQFSLLQVILLMMVNISMDMTGDFVAAYPNLPLNFMIYNTVISWTFIVLAYALMRLIYQITNTKLHSSDPRGGAMNYHHTDTYIYAQADKRKPG